MGPPVAELSLVPSLILFVHLLLCHPIFILTSCHGFLMHRVSLGHRSVFRDLQRITGLSNPVESIGFLLGIRFERVTNLIEVFVVHINP